MSRTLLIIYENSKSNYFLDNKIGGVVTACNRLIEMHNDLNIKYEIYKYCDFGDKLNFLYPVRLTLDVFNMIFKTINVKYSYCVCDHSSIIRTIIYLLIAKLLFTKKLYFLDIRGGGNKVRLDKNQKNYISLLLFMAYKLADKIILQTPNKNCIPHNFHPKIVFFPNTIYDENKKFIVYKNYKFTSKDKFKIIYTGRITETKGIEKFFELCDSRISTRIEIGLAGAIKLSDKNKSLLNKFIKTKNIIYHGVLDKGELLKVLSKYNLFLFNSEHLTEGMPNSLLDAVSVKLPILTRDIGFIKDLFVDEYFNFIQESNIYYLINYIENIIDNYSFYLLKAKKAFDFAQKNYSRKVYKSKLIQLYK